MAQKPKVNEAKATAIKRLKARGFAHIDNTATGTTLGLVDSEGFFQKVRVTRHGEIKRYRAVKAREIHKQRLPHLQEKLQVLPNGNLK